MSNTLVLDRSRYSLLADATWQVSTPVAITRAATNAKSAAMAAPASFRHAHAAKPAQGVAPPRGTPR